VQRAEHRDGPGIGQPELSALLDAAHG
jgi:hypothetical protein